MMIKWVPINSPYTARYELVDSNSIKIDGEFVEFDPDLTKFDIPEELSRNLISAFRDGSELMLELRRGYSDSESYIWEQPHYYNEGGFRGSQYEEYTEAGVIE